MIGGSGLVGALAVPLLAHHDLVLIGRRLLAIDAVQRVAPIGEWPGLVVPPVDVAISTLGTTWHAAGRSEATFRAIDHDAVIAFFAAAKAAGARHAIVVSSVGASTRWRSFYLRTKGEMEEALTALGFASLYIVRPGLLCDPRGGERRPKERLAMLVSPITDRLIPRAADRFRSIGARDVAVAIAALASGNNTSAAIYHNREILREAGSLV